MVTSVKNKKFRDLPILGKIQRILFGKGPLFSLFGDAIYIDGTKKTKKEYEEALGTPHLAIELAGDKLKKRKKSNKEALIRVFLDLSRYAINFSIVLKLIDHGGFASIFADLSLSLSWLFLYGEVRRYLKTPPEHREHLRMLAEAVKTTLLSIGALGLIFAPAMFAGVAPWLFFAAFLVVASSHFYKAYGSWQAAQVVTIAPELKTKLIASAWKSFSNAVALTAFAAIGFSIFLGGLPLLAAAIAIFTVIAVRIVIGVYVAVTEHQAIEAEIAKLAKSNSGSLASLEADTTHSLTSSASVSTGHDDNRTPEISVTADAHALGESRPRAASDPVTSSEKEVLQALHVGKAEAVHALERMGEKSVCPAAGLTLNSHEQPTVVISAPVSPNENPPARNRSASH